MRITLNLWLSNGFVIFATSSVIQKGHSRSLASAPPALGRDGQVSNEQIVRREWPDARICWSCCNVTLEVGDGEVIARINRPLLADDTGIASKYEPRLWKIAAQLVPSAASRLAHSGGRGDEGEPK